VPVHNRLAVTRRFLEYLNAQTYSRIHLVIVDDGSSDGTYEYLTQCSQTNLTVLRGDGHLWWSGAMHLGMKHVSERAGDTDFLLMLNDDVRIDPDFVTTLVQESFSRGRAVVGAAQHDERDGTTLSSGYRVNYWSMSFVPLQPGAPGPIDALPARGALFPYAAVRSTGHLHPKLFPQCMADLEYSARVRELGWPLVISEKAHVFTPYGSKVDERLRAKGWIAWRFSMRSKGSLVLRLLYFSLRGPKGLRIIALPRFLVVCVWRLATRLTSSLQQVA
jgi:GT2 family glycosyltransferase